MIIHYYLPPNKGGYVLDRRLYLSGPQFRNAFRLNYVWQLSGGVTSTSRLI